MSLLGNSIFRARSSTVAMASPLIPLALSYFLIRRGTRALSCHQSEAAKEAFTQLRPLRRLPESWIQLFQTNVDDPGWRPVFGEEFYQDTRDNIIAYANCLHELKGLVSLGRKTRKRSPGKSAREHLERSSSTERRVQVRGWKNMEEIRRAGHASFLHCANLCWCRLAKHPLLRRTA
ncbi:hypothetical protein QBC32DRAFT_121266 [Pseudoneurospora amorphoporcata]|uniref:Uncharacterized protein n=1 Tax=Pseudoneurospora amorphoporcata TaxID=241081 RepID=A0AAN6SB68_9PEZI|nr:hypothetical protein QBC32DRAFT_121266 [Pseudoneurospora amorphoporcata]